MKISAPAVELIMAQKGMSFIELARLSGISRQNISTIKNRGTCTPSTTTKLAKGLGVDPSELVEREAR